MTNAPADAGARWSTWEPGRLDPSTTAESLLGALPGPVRFRLPGRDRTRCRALTTLLHGNEPSGTRALVRYLAEGRTPATDVLGFLGAVEAARLAPHFSHRVLDGGRDLNRCFREPFPGPEGALARECLASLVEHAPEALVDLHNTSGRGPAYAVVTESGPAPDALASLFAERMVVTDLRLGTLFEATARRWPSVVVECGGAGDPAADAVAYEGLCRFLESDTVTERVHRALDVFVHPVRVELAPDRRVAFARGPLPGIDVVLDPDLDRHNFGTIIPGETLGWVGEHGLDALRVRDAASVRPVGHLLTVRAGRLVATTAFRPLMITTRADIAESDCLFYAVGVAPRRPDATASA